MRFSLITSTPNEMYAFNPFINTPAVVPLTMEAFVAPANFDPDAQDLNIFKAFAAYYNLNNNARIIYSFTSAISTLTLPAIDKISYRYGETISGADYTSDIQSGTIFTSGSTNRYVIIIASIDTITYILPIGAIWSYVGNKISYFGSVAGSSYLKYLHLFDGSKIRLVNDAFYNCTALSGLLTIPDWEVLETFFNGCTGLYGDLIIPDSITSIYPGCFFRCSGFDGILKLSENCPTIPLFWYCSKLHGDLIIPSCVTNIPNDCFYQCTGFKDSLIIYTTNFISVENSLSWLYNIGLNSGGIQLPPNYSCTYLKFNSSQYLSASTMNQSIINITSGTKTLYIGSVNKSRLLAAYPTAEANANARGITIN